MIEMSERDPGGCYHFSCCFSFVLSCCFFVALLATTVWHCECAVIAVLSIKIHVTFIVAATDWFEWKRRNE